MSSRKLLLRLKNQLPWNKLRHPTSPPRLLPPRPRPSPKLRRSRPRRRLRHAASSFRRPDRAPCTRRRFVRSSRSRSVQQPVVVRVPHRVVPCRGSLFSSARVRRDRWAPQVRQQVGRRFVRASAVPCTPRVPPQAACVRAEVWVDRAWLRRRLRDRLVLRAVVRDSVTFLAESKKVQ